MSKMKCFVVIPNEGCRQAVVNWLALHKFNYTDYVEANEMFVNMPDIDEGLMEMATVFDSVKPYEEGWSYWGGDSPDDWLIRGDTQKPYTTEEEARISFGMYISWAGEFIVNSK